jgi:hypothetical protein
VFALSFVKNARAAYFFFTIRELPAWRNYFIREFVRWSFSAWPQLRPAPKSSFRREEKIELGISGLAIISCVYTTRACVLTIS